jgi:hypothetical protein
VRLFAQDDGFVGVLKKNIPPLSPTLKKHIRKLLDGPRDLWSVIV